MKKRIMCICTAINLLMSLLIPFSMAATVSAGGIDVTDKFTDPAFRSVVLEALGKEEDDSIYKDEADKIESLFVWSTDVCDLSGIEYLSSLKALRVERTNVASVNLSGLPSLEVLHISENNKLTALSLSDIPSLNSIYCDNNALTELSLDSLPALTVLFCENNRLRTLDLTGCPNIMTIECFNNFFNNPYAIKVPDGNKYHYEYESIPASFDEIIIKLDTKNSNVLSMSLFYAYDQDPISAEEKGKYGRAKVGEIADFCEVLGIQFQIKSARMLNERFVDSIDGKYTPTEESNNLFLVKLDGISVIDAHKALAGNEFIRLVEKNTYYDLDGSNINEDSTSKSKEQEYIDVSSNDWFFENVKFVSENGIMTGTGKNVFDPNKTLTRAMAVTILYRLRMNNYSGKVLDKTISESGFNDVESNTWYTEAVNWGKEYGIVKGKTETQFDPDGAITRAEFATMILRFYKLIGEYNWIMYDLHSGEKPTDFEKIPDYAREAVSKLFSAEVIKGRPGGQFDPFDTITRAETAAMIDRFTKSIFLNVNDIPLV